MPMSSIGFHIKLKEFTDRLVGPCRTRPPLRPGHPPRGLVLNSNGLSLVVRIPFLGVSNMTGASRIIQCLSWNRRGTEQLAGHLITMNPKKEGNHRVQKTRTRLYYIVPAFPQQPDGPGVGVDLAVGGIERNVVFDGKFQVWNLVQVGPGKYNIVAETGWFSQASEGDNRGNVVVRETSPNRPWSITLQDGTYVIAEDSPLIPKIVWTLNSQESKAKVILQVSEIPLPKQQWLIKPVLDN